MIPHPDDTWKTIQETESLMEELKDLGVQIFVSLTTPFPGTFLYDNAENLGVEFVTQDTDEFNLATPVIRTKYLSVEEIEKAFERLAKISMQTLPPEMMEESAT
jgi:anaerobic magnesium-protoporphyrin IX monomethyl ester cyclase